MEIIEKSQFMVVNLVHFMFKNDILQESYKVEFWIITSTTRFQEMSDHHKKKYPNCKIPENNTNYLFWGSNYRFDNTLKTDQSTEIKQSFKNANSL